MTCPFTCHEISGNGCPETPQRSGDGWLCSAGHQVFVQDIRSEVERVLTGVGFKIVREETLDRVEGGA